ncbi:MAG: (Fe-S)-binding protein [Syntrophomonadaceae bacterium]|nr:(Fe-S)-binding protein [Syntrophomonadaceae bacterium]
MDLKQVPLLNEQLKKCVRCGRCRTVCPVLAEIKNETVAPRGHIFMVQALRDGKVKPDAQVYDRLSNCLLCETCSAVCPSGLDIPELNEYARSYIYEKNPSLIKDTLFDSIWTRPSLLRTGGFFMWAANKSGLQGFARTLGLTKLLPGDLPKAEKIMHDPVMRSARSILPVINPPRGNTKYRVGYFLGCGTDLFSPSVAIAAVEVLTSWGCEVVIPDNMKCCGLPHIANGKMSTAQSLAIHNLKVFNDLELDYIITDCGSCSSAISEKRLKMLLDKQGYDDQIDKFCSRVYDLNTFLLDVLQIDNRWLKPLNLKVTYHDPCHLAKAQGIRQAPRDILGLIPGLELIEMQDSDRCCGGSGTFSITHYDLSMKILERKMKTIADTGADVIATCCPSCTLQLKHGSNLHYSNTPVQHPVELLALASRQEPINNS